MIYRVEVEIISIRKAEEKNVCNYTIIFRCNRCWKGRCRGRELIQRGGVGDAGRAACGNEVKMQVKIKCKRRVEGNLPVGYM